MLRPKPKCPSCLSKTRTANSLILVATNSSSERRSELAAPPAAPSSVLRDAKRGIKHSELRSGTQHDDEHPDRRSAPAVAKDPSRPAFRGAERSRGGGGGECRRA